MPPLAGRGENTEPVVAAAAKLTGDGPGSGVGLGRFGRVELVAVIDGNFVVWIFQDGDLDKIAGLLQKPLAIGGQVTQMQAFALRFVFGGERVDDFKSGMIDHAAVHEVDHDILRVIANIEQIRETGRRAEK